MSQNASTLPNNLHFDLRGNKLYRGQVRVTSFAQITFDESEALKDHFGIFSDSQLEDFLGFAVEYA